MLGPKQHASVDFASFRPLVSCPLIPDEEAGASSKVQAEVYNQDWRRQPAAGVVSITSPGCRSNWLLGRAGKFVGKSKSIGLVIVAGSNAQESVFSDCLEVEVLQLRFRRFLFGCEASTLAGRGNRDVQYQPSEDFHRNHQLAYIALA